MIDVVDRYELGYEFRYGLHSDAPHGYYSGEKKITQNLGSFFVKYILMNVCDLQNFWRGL